MILHNCIKCDDLQLIPIAPLPLPRFQRYKCPKCKTVQWIKHSRINPETYSEDMINVDEKNKIVTLKNENDHQNKN